MIDLSSVLKQLSLPFVTPAHYAAADFCAAPSNALARDWLARPEGWSNGRMILWGAPDCGKTHLLHIWADACHATIFDGERLTALDHFPQTPLAIDNSDLAETLLLLHLLNAAAETGQKVLMTARHPPARQAQKLADLASRLRASLAVEIRPPEDELLELLLTKLAAERQLVMGPRVRNFLLTHLPRTANALAEAVARLDRASLDRGVQISHALAADLLRDMVETAGSPGDLLLNRHPSGETGLL